MEPTYATHPYEAAGLGVAPFRFVELVQRVGPIKYFDQSLGVTVEVGSEGQPMGTCKYCYQGIKYCCVIEDATGKRFDVGCDCVAKLNVKLITDASEKALRELRAEQRRAKKEAARQARWEAGREERERRAAEQAAKATARAAVVQAAQAQARALLGEIIEVLRAAPGTFGPDMAREMEQGRTRFSPRTVEIILQIVGKAAGRANSKKYWAAYEGALEALRRAGIVS